MEEQKDGVQIDLSPKEESQMTPEQQKMLAEKMLMALAASKNRTLSEKAKMGKDVGLLGGNRAQRRKLLKNMAPEARRQAKREHYKTSKKFQ